MKFNSVLTVLFSSIIVSCGGTYFPAYDRLGPDSGSDSAEHSETCTFDDPSGQFVCQSSSGCCDRLAACVEGSADPICVPSIQSYMSCVSNGWSDCRSILTRTGEPCLSTDCVYVKSVKE